MKNIILLIVDMQNELIESNPYNKDTVVKNINKLIEACKENNYEIVYVRHDDGKGSELEKGTYNWEIYNEIAPKNNEKVIDKVYNSAFHGTELKEYLDMKGIDTIIITGMQVEYCIDSTIKHAFELGYNVIIPEETNTTFDNEYLTGEKLYEFFNYKIWNNRFAKVEKMSEVINMLK